MENLSIDEFIEIFDNGLYDSSDVDTQIDAGWYDWFCKDSALKNKTIKLTKKLKSILPSSKINTEDNYVFFKNNCPMVGKTYDDFRICNLESGSVLYTITPKDGHTVHKNQAYVWGSENDFVEPLVEGTWKDVKNFFKD